FLCECQPDARLFRVRGDDENAFKGFLGILRNDTILGPDPRAREPPQPPRRFTNQSKCVAVCLRRIGIAAHGVVDWRDDIPAGSVVRMISKAKLALGDT